MMLNSYVPNACKRYAIAGLAIAMVAPLVAIVGDLLAGADLARAGMNALVSPFGLAAIAAPLAITGFIAGLGHRHDRLVRQLRSERAATEQLRKAAYHDSLTGLRNRHALSEDVDRILARKAAGSSSLALLLFDLDRFKFINDTLGHAAGDAVLKALGSRLQAYCRAGQRVYRLGGDEFVVLWEGSPDRETVSGFCDGLGRAVFRPVDCPGGSVDTAGSVGVALSNGGATTLSDLLKHADLALYDAKGDPEVNYRYFTKNMDADFRRRHQLENDMREGIANGAFHVDYHPVVKADTLSPTGFTARLRWNHPEHGAIAQEGFMPLAETRGLIVPIGNWMLERGLSDAAGWQQQLEITVPVSGVQLRDPEFAAFVLQALEATRISPRRLVCDVQPNATSTDSQIVLANLERLRENGVQIVVSELAASIAGLSMTRAFPVDRVRLDLRSIKALAGEKRLSQMLTLFMQLASTVETPVTLIGVDSAEDLQCAAAAGAVEVQGGFAGAWHGAGKTTSFLTSMDSLAPLVAEKNDLLKVG